MRVLVKREEVPRNLKETECEDCGSILEYDKIKDVIYGRAFDYVECPNCRKFTTVFPKTDKPSRRIKKEIFIK